MAVFAYTAVDAEGRTRTGTLTAATRTAALEEVSRSGLVPVSVAEVGEESSEAAKRHRPVRLSPAVVETFTRELANLLAAGLPLSRALTILVREASKPAARRVWSAVHDDVVGGASLADALAKWPQAFSPVYVAMVRAGEIGGFLHLVLEQIADFRTRERDLKGKVTAALVYPALLGVLACIVLVFLLTFFIPRFSGIFSEFGSRLPWLTRAIVSASQFALSYGVYAAAVAVAGVATLHRLASTPEGRRVVERLVLRLPVIGKLAARFGLVRFSRTLGTLVGAGVPLLGALRVAKEALGNQTLADAVNHAVEMVERGAPLAKSLAASPTLFPGAVVEMVAVAEETGRLDKELNRLSAVYEADLDRKLRLTIALAEPLLLFLAAGIIGTVVVGMLLPVFTLQDIVR